MLQIASGKLFTRGVGHSNELRGVLHGNFRLGREVIETAAGTILPTTMLRDSDAAIYQVTERIESRPDGTGVIVSHGVDPYLNDFAAVASFALNVTCTPDPDLAARLTGGRSSYAVDCSPHEMVPRFFDKQVWLQPVEIAHFIKLVADLIALRRKSYLEAMRAIRTYVTGMHRIADDLELAYTLLVASIESLAQGFRGCQPNWEDIEQKKRAAIDRALVGADDLIASRVRQALLKSEHVAVARNFREFALNHLQPSYFREGALGQSSPPGREEIPFLLKRAYKQRSAYIHRLKELPRIIKIGRSSNETSWTENGTMLTVQGLARLARSIIIEFIGRQPRADTEEYDYINELSGVAKVRFAAQHWIGSTNNFQANSGHARLSGFLEQLADHFTGQSNTTITDLRDLLSTAEKVMPSMNAQVRRPFTALNYLFNTSVCEELQSTNFKTVVAQYESDLTDPSVEALLAHLITDQNPGWEIGVHNDLHRAYFEQRNQANSIALPRVLEAAMTLSLAERYRASGSFDEARRLIAHAVENFPGHQELIALEHSHDDHTPIVWKHILLPQTEGTTTPRG